MKIIKEERKIVMELTQDEDEIISYFIHLRGAQVLQEYFDNFMKNRKGTMEAELKEDLFREHMRKKN